MAELTFTKTEVIEIIKSVDIQELVIPDEANRKWFKFGAYDALALACDKINNAKESVDVKE